MQADATFPLNRQLEAYAAIAKLPERYSPSRWRNCAIYAAATGAALASASAASADIIYSGTQAPVSRAGAFFQPEVETRRISHPDRRSRVKIGVKFGREEYGWVRLLVNAGSDGIPFATGVSIPNSVTIIDWAYNTDGTILAGELNPGPPPPVPEPGTSADHAAGRRCRGRIGMEARQAASCKGLSLRLTQTLSVCVILTDVPCKSSVGGLLCLSKPLAPMRNYGTSTRQEISSCTSTDREPGIHARNRHPASAKDQIRQIR